MKKSHLNIILGCILGAIFVTIWLHFIDKKLVIHYIKEVNLWYVLLGSIIYLLSYFVRSLRWRALLSPLHRFKIRQTYFYWMSGSFINYLIPIRAGELAKSYFIKRNHQIPITKTFPSVFIDKLFDTIAIFVVLILMPILHVKISNALWILISLIIIAFLTGVVILFVAAIAKDKTVKILHKCFFFVPYKYEKKLYEYLEIFVEGIGLFKNHMNLIPEVVFLTVVAVVLDSLYFMFIFFAFGQSVYFLQILFGYTLINLSYALPHPPAQIGSNELVMVLVFSFGLNFNANMVSAIMAFAHVLTALLQGSIGLIAFSYSGIKTFDLLKNGELHYDK